MNILLAGEWNFDLTSYDTVWKGLVQIGLLLIALLVGNALRNIIPFFRKTLIPSALIGGALLLLVNYIVKWVGNSDGFIDETIMQVVTYHGLGIGFVAMTLKNSGKRGKAERIKVLENGAMTGGAYMLQAVLGLLITIIFYLCTKNSSKEIFFSSGIILPLGFGQGPGNALIWGKNLALESPLTFASGKDFGLTIASIGFIVASVIGVLYINHFRKRGEIVHRIDTTKRTLEEFEGENEIPDTESIDKMTVQLCLVALVYGLAFGIMCAFAKISNFTNSLAWGFNFLWGVLTANLVKLVMKLLKKTKVMKREYVNNYQMDRISGFAFDLMIVAGVAAIDIVALKDYAWVIIVLCIAGALATFLYIRIVSKHCFKGYEHEMFVTNFGTVTGTASNGMILLKEIDPNYETPAANSFVASQLPAMLFVAPLLLLLPMFFQNQENPFKSVIIALIIFFVLFVAYTVFLFRKVLFKKKDK